MANRHRGDIDAQFDGKTYKLCLTLGALAELEDAFGAEDMMTLASRFESGRISSRDCLAIIGAGLRGAGHDIANESVATMQAERGAAGFVEIVAKLLHATFSGGQAAAPTVPVKPGAAPDKARERAAPFPGTT